MLRGMPPVVQHKSPELALFDGSFHCAVSTCSVSSLTRVQHRHSCWLEVAHIAGGDSQTMLQRCGSYEKVCAVVTERRGQLPPPPCGRSIDG